MTFKDICLEHDYTMLDDFCAEIMTEFGTIYERESIGARFYPIYCSY